MSDCRRMAANLSGEREQESLDILNQEITTLKSAVLQLSDVLEFYGSPNNWAHKGCHGGASGHRYRIVPSDRGEISSDWNGVLVGGKRARETLARYEELLKQIKGEP